jgi:hypothetical protein
MREQLAVVQGDLIANDIHCILIVVQQQENKGNNNEQKNANDFKSNRIFEIQALTPQFFIDGILSRIVYLFSFFET